MTTVTPSEGSYTRGSSRRIFQRLRDLSVGSKLNIGFGSLVAWIVFLVLLGYVANAGAKSDFERTRDTRLPSALTSATLELEMFEMIGNIQGYLSLGDPELRDEFNHDAEEVEELLHEMDELSTNWTDSESVARLDDLDSMLDDWLLLVEEMFELRDNPVANQPAVKIMLEDARPAESEVLTKITDLIEQQAQREPSAENMRLLKIMADYRSSFNLMTTSIDGYLATVHSSSKELFYDTLSENAEAWERLNNDRDLLTPDQQNALLELSRAYQEFLLLPPLMFAAVEGEQAREDLFIMRTWATPLANDIVDLLGEMRSSQVEALSSDVDSGNNRLTSAQIQTAVGTLIAISMATVLVVAIRRDIAGPITRLTDVTSRIMSGELDARAQVESRDEIGKLALSLNKMTDRLNTTLTEAEQRAYVIETSSRVSRRLSTILSQAQLVQEVVEQVQQAFSYYYAHIFLVDESGNYLVTAGGVGDAGRELVARGFRIPLDQGLVGRAAQTNSPILVEDVTQDSDYLPNPLLPDTRSEIAIPISRGDQVLGILDVQQNSTGGLTQVDVDLLESIASQVAVALLNARSYAESESRANREILINQINSKILRTTRVEQALQVAIREVGRAVDAQRTSILLDIESNDANGHS
jgi:putative methionine-R-sulfoxide reductase with GAF domain/CHASE3 domain sensor protein